MLGIDFFSKMTPAVLTFTTKFTTEEKMVLEFFTHCVISISDASDKCVFCSTDKIRGKDFFENL